MPQNKVDYEAYQYWDTQQQCTLMSLHFQPDAWAEHFYSPTLRWCKNQLRCIVLWWDTISQFTRKNVLLVNGKVNHATCLLWQFHYLLHFSLFLSPRVLLLCTLLSTGPSFFSKHIITFMSSIYVPLSPEQSVTDYINNAFILLGVGVALMLWF